MLQTQKQCISCAQVFEIGDKEKRLLKVLSLPEPGFCHFCRLVRRLAHFNLKTLNKRKCDSCAKDIFSIYSDDVDFPVFCPECWWSDSWDASEFGQDYDPSKHIFVQFKELESRVPHLSLQVDFHKTLNSDYVNGTGEVKDSYLAFNSDKIDSVFYVYSVSDSFRVFNAAHSSFVENSYFVYSSTNINSSSFVEDCHNCVNVHYSDNLKNCQDCFMCSHLSNKKYHIFNKEYSKEEYEDIINTLKIGSYAVHKKILQEYEEFKKQFPKRSVNSNFSENIEGDDIYESNNVYNSFNIIGGENVFNSQMLELGPINNAMDYSFYGDSAELVYDSVNVGTQISNVKCSMHSSDNLLDLEYSAFVHNSSYIFASVGLRNKKYSILNKEYSEQEWIELKKRIVADMNNNPYIDANGVRYRYGDFLPAELSNFYFEDSVAQEYVQDAKSRDPMMALRLKSGEAGSIPVNIDIKSEELPDNIFKASNDLVGKNIECANSGKELDYCKEAFRINKKELEFLNENKIPVPRLCVACREKELLRSRPKWQLEKKRCACFGEGSRVSNYKNRHKHKHVGACPNVFKSAKSGENIYCTGCYDSEFLS